MDLILDSKPPLGGKLSAKYKRSFAYPSIKDRVPVILTQVVDYLARDKATIIKCYGKEVQDEIKAAIGEISEFKNQLLTNKEFQCFVSSESDTAIWNADIEKCKELETDRYFTADWIFSECYIYRRLREIFATKCMLRTLDPFSYKKTEILQNSMRAVDPLFCHLYENCVYETQTVMAYSQLRTEFISLLKTALWANKFDLSLKPQSKSVDDDILTQIKSWDDMLLINDSPKIFSIFSSTDNSEKIIDYVTDNAGIELICDLCFADMLTTRFGVKRINFRVKPIPWFVSDVIPRDFKQTVSWIASSHDEKLHSVGKRWQKYLDSGLWTIVADQYWCLGKTFHEMYIEDPNLYSELEESSLIVMKGDLNYRKLIQDINWDPTTTFRKALGDFHPAPILSLRTCKADLICGLKFGQAEAVAKKDPDWLIKGEYGLILFDPSS